MLVIGFKSEKAGAGKSTLACACVKDHYLARDIFSYAFPLRRLVSLTIDSQFGVTVTPKMWDHKDEKLAALGGKSLRDFMVSLGESTRMVLGADVWVEDMRTRLAVSKRIGNKVAFIDDVRQPNEWDLCDAVIHLQTSRHTGRNDPMSGLSGPPDYQGFQATISTDKPISECVAEVESIIAMLEDAKER